MCSSDLYPHFLTSEWTLPYRANRIAELIDAKPVHDMSGFATIQQDRVSLAAQELLPILRATLPASERAKTALNALRKWTGTMDADRFDPLLFNAWVREASRQIFADELGDGLMRDYWEQRNVHRSMVNVLKNTGGQNRWCAEVTTAALGQRRCADVLSASLEITLNDLETRYGSDMSKWRWGDAHVALSEHRPFGKIPLLSNIFDIRVASPGDTFTINVGRNNLRDEKQPFANRHAASLRALYDLSNLENSLFIHSTGQSGNVVSPLYRNYAQRWADVAYLPMKTRREDVEKGKLGSLTLNP